MAQKRTVSGVQALRAHGPAVLLVVTVFALAAWRLVWIRLGPDPDSDSYGHHVIARQILVMPTELGVHWVWLPLFHYLQVPIVALGGGIDVVRYLNVALWAAVPMLLFYRLTTQGSPRDGDVAPIVGAFLCALSPIGMQMGTTAQPEPLFCLCVLGFVVAQDQKSYGVAAILLGAATMLRYEAWAVIAATALHVGIDQLRAKKLALRPWLPVIASISLIVLWTILRRFSDGAWLTFLSDTKRFANDAQASRGSLTGGGLRALPDDLRLYTVSIPWKVMGPALFLVPLGIVRAARTQGRLFFLAYLAALGFLTLTWMERSSLGLDRHFVVMVPFYCALAGSGVQQIAEALDTVPRRWARVSASVAASIVGGVALWATWAHLSDWMHEWRGAIENGWPDRQAAGAYLRTLPPEGTIFCDEATVEILSRVDRRRFDRHFLDADGARELVEDAARRDGVAYMATWMVKAKKLGIGEVVYRPPGETRDDAGLAVVRVTP